MDFDLSKIAARLERNTLPEPNSGCLLWSGHVDRKGYGRVVVGYRGRRPIRGAAHRWAYIVAFERHPGALFVCHHCDVPACVNPQHLFLGTPRDNARDAIAKGRPGYRPFNPATRFGLKITADIARAIYAAPETQAELASRHGLARQSVWKIKRGLSWRHATQAEG